MSKATTRTASKVTGAALAILLASLWVGEATAQQPTQPRKLGQGVWLNYDFVPGPHVLFYTDFSGDDVGNFPRRFKYIKGNMEVAEWQGRRWLRGSGGWAEFAIPLDRVLPERFTVEIEYFSDINSLPLQIRFQPEQNAPYVYWAAHRSGVKGNKPKINAWARTDDGAKQRRERPFFARLRVDGNTVKVYTGPVRTANSPEAPLGRSDTIFVRIPSVSKPAMLTGIRVTGGGSKIYDQLIGKGHAIAHGIYFDTGNSTIKHESAPTLKEVCTTLKKHPDIAIEVGGHTDARGEESYNMDLSQRRAEAVRGYLVEDCGVSAERVRAKGFGESNPIAPNDTPEGQQENRRVELTVEETVEG